MSAQLAQIPASSAEEGPAIVGLLSGNRKGAERGPLRYLYSRTKRTTRSIAIRSVGAIPAPPHSSSS